MASSAAHPKIESISIVLHEFYMITRFKKNSMNSNASISQHIISTF